MKWNWPTALAAVALVFGLWVRFHGADQRWVWRDEQTTLLHVMGYAESDVDASHPSTMGQIAASVSVPAPGGPRAVVSALEREDAQHPPFYYLGQRLWDDAGGNALGRRSFAVLIGIAAVAAIGWFAFVLSGARAGALSLAFGSVSPFLVLYGQQMREYGLLCACIALASALLVVAVRRGSPASWIAYALVSAAALWASPLALLPAPAHLVYAAYCDRRRALLRSVVAWAAAVALFAPWLWAIFVHRKAIVDANSWSATPYALPALVAKLLFTASSAFTDLGYANRLGIVLGGLVLIAIAVAAVVLARTDRGAAVLLGAMVATTTLLPFVADLASGQHRSASSRYLCALVVVIVVGMACALANAPPRIAAPAATALVVLAALSSYVGTSSPVWWDNHGDSSLIEIAAVLRREGAPPVVYDNRCVQLVGLARIVPANENVLCGPGADAPLEAGWYVVSPSPRLVARARGAGLKIVSVAGGQDAGEAVRAFRSRQAVADDEPVLAKIVR
jgi:uncharacterized membrane protein